MSYINSTKSSVRAVALVSLDALATSEEAIFLDALKDDFSRVRTTSILILQIDMPKIINAKVYINGWS